MHKNYSYHVVSILFVAIYHISCSDEFVNHSQKNNLKYIYSSSFAGADLAYAT